MKWKEMLYFVKLAKKWSIQLRELPQFIGTQKSYKEEGVMGEYERFRISTYGK